MFELKSLYFNSAYLGPMPIRSKQKIEAALQRGLDPAFFEFNYDNHGRARQLLASLLGCASVNIAISTSVSELVSHVANGMQLGPGDEIVLPEGEYPSLVLPWMVLAKLRGFEIRFLDLSNFLDPSKLNGQLRAKTKFAAVSHVQFNTGRMLPIAELGQVCRKQGVLFLSDISQSFGGMPISPAVLENVDILVGVGYKWLLGPYGSAFGFFSDGALRRVERTHASWLNSPNATSRENLLQHTADCLPGARKFDRGEAPSFLICAGLEGSLELLQEVGLENIGRHNKTLVEKFLRGLPTGYKTLAAQENSSNIVCVTPTDKDPLTLKADLAAKNIDVSVREGALRFSFHFFNTPAQVQSLLEALGQCQSVKRDLRSDLPFADSGVQP